MAHIGELIFMTAILVAFSWVAFTLLPMWLAVIAVIIFCTLK